MSTTKRAPLLNNTNAAEGGSSRKKSKQPSVSSILSDPDELWERLYDYKDAAPWEMLQKIGFFYKSNRYHHPKIDQTFDSTDDIRNFMIRYGIPNRHQLNSNVRLSMELWVRLTTADRNKLTSARMHARNVDEEDTSQQYEVRKLKDSHVEKILKSYGFTRMCHLWQGMVDGILVEGDLAQIRDKLRAAFKIGDSKRRRYSININDVLSLQLWAASSPNALANFEDETEEAGDMEVDEETELNNDEEDADPPEVEPVENSDPAMVDDDEGNANLATAVGAPVADNGVDATFEAVEAEIKDLEAKVKKAHSSKGNLQDAIDAAKEFNSKAKVVSQLLEKALKARDMVATIDDEQSIDFFESEISRLESFDMAAIEHKVQDLESAGPGRATEEQYNTMRATLEKKREKLELARAKMEEYHRALAALKE